MANPLSHTKFNPILGIRGVAKSAISRGLFTVYSMVDKVWVRLRGNHVINPATIGGKDHDCALASIYWAAPWIPEVHIVEAFEFCTENWPYGGVTNKEFAIALKYLNAEACYYANTETLGALLNRNPVRCVALLHGHFIAIVNGKPVGRDAHLTWDPKSTVYCHWTFRPQRFQLGGNSRRIS